MKINIKATGIELTPAISHYATKKVSSLEKYVRQKDAVAQIEIGPSITRRETSSAPRSVSRARGLISMLLQNNRIFMPPLT